MHALLQPTYCCGPALLCLVLKKVRKLWAENNTAAAAAPAAVAAAAAAAANQQFVARTRITHTKVAERTPTRKNTYSYDGKVLPGYFV